LKNKENIEEILEGQEVILSEFGDLKREVRNLKLVYENAEEDNTGKWIELSCKISDHVNKISQDFTTIRNMTENNFMEFGLRQNLELGIVEGIKEEQESLQK
jgi:hypothetical protein